MGAQHSSSPPIPHPPPPPPSLLASMTPPPPPSLLASIMLLLLESIVFEECQNQWSLSRPLMCLIMLLPEQYEQVRLPVWGLKAMVWRVACGV